MNPTTTTTRGTWAVLALLAVLVLVAVRIALDARGAREAGERALAAARAAEEAAAAGKASAERAAAAVADLQADLEMLASGVGAVERQMKEIADQLTFGGNPFGAMPGQDPGGPDAPPAQPVMEFTPELREALRKSVAARGVTLKEDRVEIPGSIAIRQGALEFLAVLPGGKIHESVIVLTGSATEDGPRAEGLGAALNSCLMAIGLRPGTPVRILPGGRALPAKGTPVHISVEWNEEKGRVRVRAEDFLWDRERNRSLEPGKWIYVGSFFDVDGYVPDLTGDGVACYSVPTCVVDLADARAANDSIFVACGPRIPPEGTPVTVIFSRDPLEPTRTWDPEEPSRVTDGAASPAPPERGEEAPGGGR